MTPRTTTVVLDGLAFPEGPRWHDERLWFSDQHDKRVVAMDVDGEAETIVEVPQQASGLGWLTDGRLLVVSMLDRKVMRLETDATLALPSGSTAIRHVSRGFSPPYMSNPKLPTYARPWPSTTMSLHAPGASSERSACTTRAPSGSSRITLRSSIETTRRRSSGNQPNPDACCGTSTIVSAVPSTFIATTRLSC
jgi:hypothetical protein